MARDQAASTGEAADLPLGRQRPSLAAVRRWVRLELMGEDTDAVADVLLVVNELVSNAYRYTSEPSFLRVVVEAHKIRIEIAHDARAHPPLRKVSRPQRGYGLVLVARLSDRWGVDRAHGGTVVWAVLPRET
ncbi:ATP-binding protein [Lentzea flaviverrucosa]|uniref:Anti-sigma regulatory factor (Ser/Thr protein kinase) n=1 Tax=Lentzea flaviverrucosa TaxID=200379 RepID=A0A1H9JVE7_9PSEU|nr:ATP-binding protein [Lentzea flaviverrucosa]RDI26637.1 anti-sigma regulatory factor (Ser/Thr protein kinase) [Lentzea flaviverrucosa]SEQ90515.1 Anti-sigma regulatory factor (Ser/Thr protein kinase) [Lentzea flaviverrucosa]